jgi:hypothetical protein
MGIVDIMSISLERGYPPLMHFDFHTPFSRNDDATPGKHNKP